jgi:hypothetical protein
VIGRLKGTIVHKQPPWMKARACDPQDRACLTAGAGLRLRTAELARRASAKDGASYDRGLRTRAGWELP